MAWAAASLLLAGLPFRLSTQYWRFATISDLVGVGAASVAATALFIIGLVAGAGVAPPSPAYPALFLMSLVLLLVTRGAARARLRQQGKRRCPQPRIFIAGSPRRRSARSPFPPRRLSRNIPTTR